MKYRSWPSQNISVVLAVLTVLAGFLPGCGLERNHRHHHRRWSQFKLHRETLRLCLSELPVPGFSCAGNLNSLGDKRISPASLFVVVRAGRGAACESTNSRMSLTV